MITNPTIKGILKGNRITVTVLNIGEGWVSLRMSLGADADLIGWESGPLRAGESFTVPGMKIEMPYMLKTS